MWNHRIALGCGLLAVLVAPTVHAQINGEPDLVPYSLDPHTACGPLCLAFLERYFSGNRSYAEIASICAPGTQGTSLADIKNSANELGYVTRSFGARSEQLKHLTAPAILHLKSREGNTHFVVLLYWDEEAKLFHLFDPPERLLNLNENTISENFTGIGLLVSEKSPPGSIWLVTPPPALPLWLIFGICTLDVFVIVFVSYKRLTRNGSDLVAASTIKQHLPDVKSPQDNYCDPID